MLLGNQPFENEYSIIEFATNVGAKIIATCFDLHIHLQSLTYAITQAITDPDDPSLPDIF